jgi:SAM-dependent methyltransferase
MKLNPVELLLVNNPIRDALLRNTVGWLHEAACAPPVGRVLEIGCGQGDGVREIARRFHPAAIDAFDLDGRWPAPGPFGADGASVRLWVSDAERIAFAPAASTTPSSATISTTCRLAPGARRGAAVLRPGGFFLFEELSLEFFTQVPLLSALLHRFTVHPWDTMFDFPTFRRTLQEAGLRLTALRTRPLAGWHQGVAVRD